MTVTYDRYTGAAPLHRLFWGPFLERLNDRAPQILPPTHVSSAYGCALSVSRVQSLREKVLGFWRVCWIVALYVMFVLRVAV